MATKQSTAKQTTKRAAKPAQAPAAPAPVQAPAPAAVALRGGPAVARVALTGKAYRTGAKHNADWWATITSHCGTLDGVPMPSPVAELVEKGVPTHFIGYAIRRGYLTPA